MACNSIGWGYSPGNCSDSRLRRTDSRAAGSRHLHRHRADRCRSSLRRWPFVEMDRGRRCCFDSSSLSADFSCRLSPGAHDGVPKSRHRSPRRRLSIAAIAHRCRVWWFYRRWVDGEQTKIVLPAGSSHRLHLCRDLRRAGIYRRYDRDCAVRSVWLARATCSIRCTG